MTKERMAFDMKKPCDSCPFLKTVPLDGAPDWALDVARGFWAKSITHSCHKSDPNADGFVGVKRTQHCIGILGVMKNTGNIYSQDAVRALVTGELDWDKVPTESCWDSPKQMMAAYLNKYKAEGLLDEVPNATALPSETVKK